MISIIDALMSIFRAWAMMGFSRPINLARHQKKERVTGPGGGPREMESLQWEWKELKLGPEGTEGSTSPWWWWPGWEVRDPSRPSAHLQTEYEKEKVRWLWLWEKEQEQGRGGPGMKQRERWGQADPPSSLRQAPEAPSPGWPCRRSAASTPKAPLDFKSLLRLSVTWTLLCSPGSNILLYFRALLVLMVPAWPRTFYPILSSNWPLLYIKRYLAKMNLILFFFHFKNICIGYRERKREKGGEREKRDYQR